MKTRTWMVLVVAMLAMLWLLAGCGEEATTTTAPTGTETTSTTMDTSTTMSGGGGIDIPPAVAGAYTDLSPELAKALIDSTPDLVIIDVSPHYDDGHLPGAVHHYFADGSLQAAIPTLDKEATYLVYCHVDSVAIAGAEALVEAGFEKVYRLEGNYAAWVAAGYPVEK